MPGENPRWQMPRKPCVGTSSARINKPNHPGFCIFDADFPAALLSLPVHDGVAGSPVTLPR